ncbi:MAG TPA: 7TM-DISM domain-containing protein, partial [Turneriella sp.]|nr:7TM-DISM domain-containing protein [Turneriella sp.]
MRFLLRYVLIAFSFAVIPLSAAENFPVQVIDMGNTNATVSLESGAKNASTWFVSDKPVDPMAFSSQMLKGEKRKEATPQSFTPVAVPSNLVKLFGEKKVGETIWYYKSFIAPSNPLATLSLRLGKINDADEVYLNGILIGKSGSTSLFDHAWDKVRVYDIPSSLLRPLEKNIILIRVHVYFSNEYGIIRDHVQIGDSEIMNRELIVNDILVLVFLSCYLTFGLYFLFLFLRRPTEKSYLLFSLFIFTLVLYQFLQTQVKYYVSANFLALKRIEYLALFSIFPAFYFYLREFFQVKTNKVFRYIHWGLYAFFAVIVVLYGFVLLVDNPLAWTSWNERVYLKYIMPVLITVSFAIVVYKIFKRDKNARAIMVGLFFLLVTLVIDNLVYYGIINVPRVTSYVIFTFIMSLAFILANQFVRVHKQVEDLNRNLEKKVEERTQELRESLTRV